LERSLAKAQIGLDEILENSTEVILFGSRAVGRGNAKSDWDILLVDARKGFEAMGIDFVTTSSENPVNWRNWLASELAHHVVAYGVWIKGDGHWTSELVTSPDVVTKKRSKLKVRLKSLIQAWNELSDLKRSKWQTLIRRDIQRLEKLKKHIAVPPTPILDEEFSARCGYRGDFAAILENDDERELSQLFLELRDLQTGV